LIVVHTNVVVPLLVRTEQSAASEQLYALGDEWYAPLLWRSELTSALMAIARRGLINPPQARTALDESNLIIPPEHEVRSDPQDIFALALASGCTAYDCEYIAVAKLLGAPLATWDKHLLAAFPNDAATPETLLGL
jgi:predicted nucleic acid-binding protein